MGLLSHTVPVTVPTLPKAPMDTWASEPDHMWKKVNGGGRVPLSAMLL